MTTLQENHYRILGLPEPQHPNKGSFDQEILKTAYRNALLLHHPDKIAGNPPKTTESSRTSPKVVSIDQVVNAYTTLSDPALRTAYDKELFKSQKKDRLAASKAGALGLETWDLEDLQYDDEASTWTRLCRCGGKYQVNEQELERATGEGEVILSCPGCSLCVRVTFETVDEHPAT